MKRIISTIITAFCLISATSQADNNTTVINGYGPVKIYGGFSIKGEEFITDAVYACNSTLYKLYANTSKNPVELTLIKTGDGIDCLLVPYRHELKVKLPKAYDKATQSFQPVNNFVLLNEIQP